MAYIPSGMSQELLWWVCGMAEPCMALQTIGRYVRTELRLGLHPRIDCSQNTLRVRPRIVIGNEDMFVE